MLTHSFSRITGLEIRIQVTEYTISRISALRTVPPSISSTSSSPPPPLPSPSQSPPNYQNISALRANTMKFLPNLFHKSQLTKIFLCFPDPHFKARKHKARIISPTLVAEYAYVLREGGRVYVVTDVRDLYDWFRMSFGSTAGRELFREVRVKKKGGEGEVDVHGANDEMHDAEEEVEREEEVEEEEEGKDPCITIMQTSTEEGKKVSRNGGDKFIGVWQRKGTLPWPGPG